MHPFFKAELIDENVVLSGDSKVFLGQKFEGDSGIYAEWLWDGTKLVLKNDRYGFYPVYYYCTDKIFAVSPSISKLLEISHDREFDENAFSVFLRLGWLIGEDTLFKTIRALPPNSVLSWQSGKLDVSSENPVKQNPFEQSRNQAKEIYAELFQSAVEKTLPSDNENFSLPLSGGRDSRHILFALIKANRKPDVCLTLIHPPPRSNEDSKIAGLLCQNLNIKHQIIEQSKSRFSSERLKNELTGYTADEHGWFLALAQFVNSRWKRVYDGIAGDVLSAGLFLSRDNLTLYQQEKFEELADKILLPEGFIPALITSDNYRKFSREKAVDHLTNEIKRHAGHPNPVASFYFWNRTRRCIAVSPFRLFNSSINIVTPYLENELFDFLFSLPAEMMLDHKFHDETISFAFPEFAHIPYEDKNSASTQDINNYKLLSREILQFSMTKKNRKLINRNFFLTRCLRGFLDKNYSRTITEFGNQAILLLQLERL